MPRPKPTGDKERVMVAMRLPRNVAQALRSQARASGQSQADRVAELVMAARVSAPRRARS